MTQGHTVGQAIIAALATFGIWTAATWFLEGRIETLLRPDPQVSRLIYALVANVSIGILGSFLVLRRFRPALVTDAREAGFAPAGRSLSWIAAGAVAGFAFYVLQGALSSANIRTARFAPGFSPTIQAFDCAAATEYS